MSRGARGAWCALTVALVALVAVGGASGAAAQSTPEVPSDQELLDRFAPVVGIRHQEEPCGDGERYLPVAVDTVLGRDDVVLRDEDGTVVTKAPTVADLAGGGEDRWIDLPGDALRPGCSYEEWFDSLDASPAIYGRVTTDRGRLVLQYWFFWVYNQFNDLHEGDWEMIQLVFDTADPAAAMQTTPSVYVYAQHEGSEYGDAGDPKVVLVDGTHPLVYPSEGSHASFFSSSRWFGKSGATGFGCDDTTGPTERLRPEVIVLPEDAPTDGAFAWLSYEGHWGQQERAFDDGPTGPATKTQWDSPVAWLEDEGRDASVELPFAGSRATETFCEASLVGSWVFNQFLDAPLLVVAALAVLVVLITVMVRASSRGTWSRAMRTWRANPRTSTRTGVVIVPAYALALLLQVAVQSWTPIGTLVDVVGASSAWVLPLVSALHAVVLVPVVSWVVVRVVADSGTAPGRSPGPGQPARPRAPVAAVVVTILVVVATGVSAFVFLPLLLVVARLLVAPVAAVGEDLHVRAALQRSNRLVRGHTWRALGILVTAMLLVLASGLPGALLLAFTPLSFVVAGFATALVNVVLVPILALAAASFFGELRDAEPDET